MRLRNINTAIEDLPCWDATQALLRLHSITNIDACYITVIWVVALVSNIIINIDIAIEDFPSNQCSANHANHFRTLGNLQNSAAVSQVRNIKEQNKIEGLWPEVFEYLIG